MLHVLEESLEADTATLSPDEAAVAEGGTDLLLAGIIPAEWEERLICRSAAVFGVPWIEITRYAWEHECDVIVIGASTRRFGLSRWLRGSTTDQVVHHAPCPILVVTDPDRQFPLS